MAEFALANKRNRTMTTKVPPAASAILETHGRGATRAFADYCVPHGSIC